MDKVTELVKQGKIKEIADIRDETDLSGLKLAIDLKRGTDPDKLMAKLFKLTPLLDSQACNFNILIQGQPRVMGVREILTEWTSWRMECVRRRLRYSIGKRKNKLHLLQGLEKILLNINKAIKIIRETEKDEDVKKKYATPRRTTIIYDHQTEAATDVEDEIPDYPVSVFLSQEGYLKKITPQSLRMASDQKYKDGDGLAQQWEASNRDELMLFTDQQQCYKTRLSEFDDTKASALGDYLPTKLDMAPGEKVVWACIPGDYSGTLLFFFENGKVARVGLAGYQTQTRRKKLTGAYSGKSPLATALLLREDQDIAVLSSDNRCVVFDSSLLTVKGSRTTQGVAVMSLKAGRTVNKVSLLTEMSIQKVSRYKAKSLPAVGANLLPADS